MTRSLFRTLAIFTALTCLSLGTLGCPPEHKDGDGHDHKADDGHKHKEGEEHKKKQGDGHKDGDGHDHGKDKK